MSATNQTYLISYDLPIEANQADFDLLSRIFDNCTINGECWEAAGTRHPQGYVYLTAKNTQRINYVHRYVCHLYHGLPLDHTTHHCHHVCANKACCRPSHLTPLTITEHHEATQAAGQYPCGDQASWSAIPEAKVVEYRRRYRAGEKCPALAEEAGVASNTMYYALTGGTYEHVPGAVTDIPARRDNSGEKHHRARFKDSDILDIYTAYWVGGLSTLKLGVIYGVSDETIRGIVNGTAWKHVDRPAINKEAA